MGIFTRATDYYLTYKFIKALIQPFDKTDAYKLGIIDDEGNILKKKRDLKTSEEKDAYGYFNRMVWNLKKLIQKVPIIGNICMDQSMVLLDDIPDAKIGDEVVLIGKQNKTEITADDMAVKWGTINYEVICGLASRMPRYYMS